MPSISEMNQKLVFWVGTTAVALMLGVGTPVYNGIQTRFEAQQVQIDENRRRIWEQQRTYVTEETLSRRLSEIMQIVDTKIGSIHDLQREHNRQLNHLIQSQNEFQRDIRDTLQNKADR